MRTDNEIYATFSRALAYYLAINNMKQNEFADKMNVSVAAVNDWIKGRKIPRMSRVDKMCIIFGCRRSDFLEDKIGDEESLLEEYRSLNEDGKEKVKEYIHDLTMSGRYNAKGTPLERSSATRKGG